MRSFISCDLKWLHAATRSIFFPMIQHILLLGIYIFWLEFGTDDSYDILSMIKVDTKWWFPVSFHSFDSTRNFLTLTNICHCGVFLQIISEPTLMILYMYIKPIYTKEYRSIFMQHALLILNNNDTKSQNFTSLTKGKYRTFMIPSW